MACYLFRRPEFVSDLSGAANENKKKQQLQQKPATAEATGAGADMSTRVWEVANVNHVIYDFLRDLSVQCFLP